MTTTWKISGTVVAKFTTLEQAVNEYNKLPDNVLFIIDGNEIRVKKEDIEVFITPLWHGMILS